MRFYDYKPRKYRKRASLALDYLLPAIFCALTWWGLINWSLQGDALTPSQTLTGERP